MVEQHPLFTDEEINANHTEGWDIFEAEGSIQNENGDRPFQLQRLDEADILVDDMAAWTLVWNGTEDRHRKVIEFLKQHSPAEYAAIENYVRGE